MANDVASDRVQVDHGSHPEPTHSVVWLHGLGADGHDFEPIVPALGLPKDLSIRFIFPHARVRPVTLNGGVPMRAWYDVRSLDGPRDDDREGVNASTLEIESILASERARGVPADHMVLAGFSQGGAMAYHVGLRHAETLAGILVMSAYLLHENDLEDEASDANRATPILQCHGTHDPVVPLAMGHGAKQTLGSFGYDIDWRTYPTAHDVHPQEIIDVGEWLAERCS